MMHNYVEERSIVMATEIINTVSICYLIVFMTINDFYFVDGFVF